MLEAIATSARPLVQPGLIRSSTAEVQIALAAVVKVAAGKRGASPYQKAVAHLLGLLFADTLGAPHLETEVDEGRKRIDFTMVNNAETGFFRWIAREFRASYVYCEAKNYTDDPKNPELDQLIGRFMRRTRFGFVLCRDVKNRELMTKRCRDIVFADQGLVLVLDNKYLETLVGLYAGDRPDEALSTWLHNPSCLSTGSSHKSLVTCRARPSRARPSPCGSPSAMS